MTPRNRPPSAAPGMLPMPPDGGREGLDARHKAHEEVGLFEDEHPQDGGNTGHGGADGERGGDGAVDIDAHQRRHVFIPRPRREWPGRFGALHEEIQTQQGHNRDGKNDDARLQEFQPRIVTRPSRMAGTGKGLRSPPNRPRNYCQKKDAPIAVMSGTEQARGAGGGRRLAPSAARPHRRKHHGERHQHQVDDGLLIHEARLAPALWRPAR